jgi:pilus assembly protein Flp/PilA
MTDLTRRLVRGQDGATAAEYAIMAALLGTALVTALTSLGDAIGGRLSTVSRAIGADPTPPAPPIRPAALRTDASVQVTALPSRPGDDTRRSLRAVNMTMKPLPGSVGKPSRRSDPPKMASPARASSAW